MAINCCFVFLFVCCFFFGGGGQVQIKNDKIIRKKTETKKTCSPSIDFCSSVAFCFVTTQQLMPAQQIKVHTCKQIVFWWTGKRKRTNERQHENLHSRREVRNNRLPQQNEFHAIIARRPGKSVHFVLNKMFGQASNKTSTSTQAAEIQILHLCCTKDAQVCLMKNHSHF